MGFDDIVSARPQPLDQVNSNEMQVGVLDTQETDGDANVSKILTSDVEATANTITIVEGRPYLIRSTVDCFFEVKQSPGDVDIDDATSASPPLPALEPLISYFQPGAQISVIRDASDGTIFVIPF